MTVMLPQHLQLSPTTTCVIDSPPTSTASTNPYLVDQIQFMQSQETSLYQITIDPYNVPTTTVSTSDRRTMCSWSYDIVDACSIDREVAVIAMEYFDRFLTTNVARAKSSLVSRREFQLAFIACLIIALKCRAGMQVDSDFVSTTICQGLYRPKDIVDMEREVLAALGWRLNGPSPHEFIGAFLELLPATGSGGDDDEGKLREELKGAAIQRVENAVRDYDTVLSTSPSGMAHAALMTAMATVDSTAFHPVDRHVWTRSIGMVTGLKANEPTSIAVGYSSPAPAARRRVSSYEAVSSSPSSTMDDCRMGTMMMMCTTATAAPRRVSSDGSGTMPPRNINNFENELYGGSSCYTGYCAPAMVSSATSSLQSSLHGMNDHHHHHQEDETLFANLYRDVLSMASNALMGGTDGGDSNMISPVCAMLNDGRLDI